MRAVIGDERCMAGDVWPEGRRRRNIRRGGASLQAGNRGDGGGVGVGG